MAEGFTYLQRNKAVKSKKNPGYTTLFERIEKEAAGQKRSLSWYRSAVAKEASKYKKNFEKYRVDEAADATETAEEQDQNELRKFVVEGHLYMFQYKAKMRWLPYYDRYPLVYVIKANKNEFWGANLHYMSMKKRVIATQKLLNGRINIPKACFHKYLTAHVEGLYLDLAAEEWATAILLPTADFVKNVNGVSFPISPEVVWEDTDETFYDQIRAGRKVKGYGTKQSREMSI